MKPLREIQAANLFGEQRDKKIILNQDSPGL